MNKNDDEPLPWETISAEEFPLVKNQSGAKAPNLPSEPEPEPVIIDKPPKTPCLVSEDLKLEIILETLKESATQSELSRKYQVSQALISLWRRIAIEAIRSHLVSNPKDGSNKTEYESEMNKLLNQADRDLFEHLHNVMGEAIYIIAQILDKSADLPISQKKDN